jgi:hypothetical protein
VLWGTAQKALDEILSRTTLRDLVHSEVDMRGFLFDHVLPEASASTADMATAALAETRH